MFKPSFLLNSISEIPPCLCFCLQFELKLSSFSAGESSQQLGLSDIPGDQIFQFWVMSHYQLEISAVPQTSF